jgi:hypothetical protein
MDTGVFETGAKLGNGRRTAKGRPEFLGFRKIEARFPRLDFFNPEYRRGNPMQASPTKQEAGRDPAG